MNITDKNKVKGFIGTVLFHAILIIALVFAYLYYSYPPKENELLEPKKEEIFFGGEYVMLGDVLHVETNSNTSGGAVPDDYTEPSPVVTQEAESPMKVQPVEQTPEEPTAEELAAEAERFRKEKEDAEKSAKIKNIMGGAFKKSSSESKASTGSSEESLVAKTAIGAPGVSGLEGYTLASWGRPNSPVQGVIKIRVKVNSRGKVTEARFIGGSGSAASNQAVRRSCEEASKESTFSVPKNTTTEGVGEIIWRFENN